MAKLLSLILVQVSMLYLLPCNSRYYTIIPSMTEGDFCNKTVDSSCLTLSQLACNWSMYVTSNTTLLFVRGVHILDKNITVSGIREISMLGNESYAPSSSVITCIDYSRFTMSDISRVNLNGLAFQGCRGNKFLSVSQLVIDHATFTCNRTQTSENFLTITRSTITISSSSFHSNVLKNSLSPQQLLPPVSCSEIVSSTIGGTLVVACSKLDVVDSCFDGNTASIGGAMFAIESNVSVNSSVFRNNRAIGYAHMFGYGGALCSFGTGVILVLGNNKFVNNTADQHGGVIAVLNNHFILFPQNHNILSCNCTLGSNHNNMLIFEHNVVLNNKAGNNGGSLFLFESSVTIIHCNFSRNTAEKMGGAIAGSNSTNITLYGSTFDNNSANVDGGVISIQHKSTILVNSCSFVNNTAQNHGGVFNALFNTTVNVVSGNFTSNTAGTGGGCAFLTQFCEIGIEESSFVLNNAKRRGGVCEARIHSSVIVKRSTFIGSHAGVYGGVFQVKNKTCLFINGSIFENNFVLDTGGVFDSYGSCTIEIYNSNFCNNVAKIIGGVSSCKLNSAFYAHNCTFTNNSARVIGGVLNAEDDTNVTVCDCKLIDNSADYGGGIRAVRRAAVHVENTTFINTKAGTNGGILMARMNSTVCIFKSTLVSNSVANDGIVFISNNCTALIMNSTFNSNMAGHDGSAVYVYDSSNVTINRTEFNSNRAGGSGGAVYARKMSNVMVNNCTIRNSTAGTSGGGIFAEENSSISIVMTTFLNNTADYGAAVSAYVATNVTIFDSNFNGNTARIEGGFTAAYKCSTVAVFHSKFTCNNANFGGVAIAYQNSKFQFESCILLNNSAKYGGVTRAFQASSATFIKCNVWNNNAEYGGVISIDGSNASLSSSNFSHNTASYGGTLYATASSAVVVYNCVFSTSRAQFLGGTMAIFDSIMTGNSSQFFESIANNSGGVIRLLNVSATIFNCAFNLSRSGRDGGAVFADNSLVEVDTCFFSTNNAARHGGAFMAIGSTLMILNSEFINNTANSSGGAVFLDRSSDFTVKESTFKCNEAIERGGALCAQNESKISIGCRLNATTRKISVQDNGDSVNFQSHFDCSKRTMLDSITVTAFYQNLAGIGGGISLSESNIYFGSNATICHNKATQRGGGMYALNSSIVFAVGVSFDANCAELGGGISLASSHFYDKGNGSTIVEVKLVSNQANFGGAFYIDDKKGDVCLNNPETHDLHSGTSARGCFFYKATEHLRIFFNSNNATINGSDIYGGLLDRCAVSSRINASVLEADGESRIKKLSNILSFDTVSSKPVRLCYCDNKNKRDCSQLTRKITIKQGDDLNFSIAAVDHVNHTVRATIHSRFIKHPESILERSRVQSISEACSSIDYQLSYPITKTEHNLILFAEGPCGNKSISTLTVKVRVINCTCANGFVRANYTKKCVCTCDKIFSKYIKHCNSTLESVIREGTFWIKYLNVSEHSSPYLIYPYCPLDYCHPPSEAVFVNLNLPDGSDTQCANNRGGLLCGNCQTNYSLSLGSSKCLRCPDNWYVQFIGITIAAFFAGIVLVLMILVLNLTVAVGTLNSTIFYVNIINASNSIYLGRSNLLLLPVFIDWLNLNIGFDTCFIKGMDSYIKTWLQLAFPSYIIFLVLLVIWISSCSSRFSSFIGKKNPVATLATLILLSYTKLLDTVITSLSFVNLKYPNGSAQLKWLPDASINYSESKHIPLVVASVLVLIFGSIYTIVLSFWQCLLRCPRSRAFNWTRNQKLHYFIDTYHVPHTAKHRYWTGLLLVVRVVVYLISTFSVSIDPRITLLSTNAIMGCLLLYKTVFIIKVYKNWLLNAMDSLMLFNVIIFATFTWYTIIDDPGNRGKETVQKAAAYVCVGTVFVIFVLVIIFHIYRYSNNKVYAMSLNSKFGRRIQDKILKVSTDLGIDHDTSLDRGPVRGRYSLMDDIDYARENQAYTPPSVCLQQVPTSSTVSIGDSEN